MSDNGDRDIKPGELQLVLAAEESMEKNVRAILEHANETRRLLRDVQASMKVLENSQLTLRQLYDRAMAQIGFLNAKLLGGGSTVHGDKH